MGLSDKPLLRYSTSEMAKDVLEILDHLGWTAERELHVAGVSMGGMIAQELVRSPKSIAISSNKSSGFNGPSPCLFLEPHLHGRTNREHNLVRRKLAHKSQHVPP
jgi:esterase/lipase